MATKTNQIGTCPDHGEYFMDAPDSPCPACCDTETEEDIETELLPGEDMDGDAASALASAGLGTDEDYEHNLIDDCDCGGDW